MSTVPIESLPKPLVVNKDGGGVARISCVKEGPYIAPGQYHFSINTLGECCRNDDFVFSGSINISEFAARLGRKWNAKRAQWPITKKEYDDEFIRLAREQLPQSEYEFYKHVTHLQKVNNGRFRIYGHIIAQEWLIEMVTEFAEYVDREAMWKLIENTAAKLGADMRVMAEDPETDARIENFGKPNQKAVTGPNHGRIRKQVEFAWNVTNMGLDNIRTLKRSLSAKTEKIWKECGVAVG